MSKRPSLDAPGFSLDTKFLRLSEVEALNCPICFEAFNLSDRLPQNLTCRHDVCATCLSNMQKTSSAPVRCPVCRVSVTFPVPNNRLIIELLEKTKATNSALGVRSSTPLAAGSHSWAGSHSTCSDEEKKCSIASHSSVPLRYWCERCNVLTCSECLVGPHQGHAYLSVQGVFDDFRRNASGLLDQLKAQIEVLQSSLQYIDTRHQSVCEDADEAAARTETAFLQYQEELGSRKRQLLQEISVLKATQQAALANEQRSLNSAVSRKQNVCEVAQGLLNGDILSAVSGSHDLLHALRAEVETVHAPESKAQASIVLSLPATCDTKPSHVGTVRLAAQNNSLSRVATNHAEPIAVFTLSNLPYPVSQEKQRQMDEIAMRLPSRLACPLHTHNLLLTSRVYNALYICNKCNLGGYSWCYHCSECRFDLHPSCVPQNTQAGYPSFSKQRARNEVQTARNLRLFWQDGASTVTIPSPSSL